MSASDAGGRGIALLCDTGGCIVQVLSDALPVAHALAPGLPLERAVDPADAARVVGFLSQLRSNGTALRQRFSVAAAGVPLQLTLAGATAGDRWLIVMADSPAAVMQLCDRVRLIGDSSLDAACQTLIGLQRDFGPQDVSELRLYEEVSRLNNELINLRRQLEGKVARQTSAIRASDRRFRAIFEQASLGIVLADLQGRVMDLNPSMERLLTVDGTASQQRPALELLTVSDDARTLKALNRELLAGQREHFRTQQRVLRGELAASWIDISGTTVRDETGRPAFVLYTFDDITGQKQTQNALLQAERLTIAGRLAATLVHEINNPLQSVIGFLGLAQEAFGEGESIERYMQTAMEELRRVSHIVHRLRDLNLPSRLEEPQPTDVEAILQRVMALSKQQCVTQGIVLDVQLEPDLPAVAVVPDRLQQVFLNLVLNAVDAMPNGGRLQVSTARTESPAGIAVTFKDTGVGIPDEVLAKLFDPFYSTKPDGLGLGLFISRDIVEQYGGRITAESPTGDGARFVVWLPT